MSTKTKKSKKNNKKVHIEMWAALEFEGLSPQYLAEVPEYEGDWVEDAEGDSEWVEDVDVDGNPIPVLDEDGNPVTEQQWVDRSNVVNTIVLIPGARDDKKAEKEARREVDHLDAYSHKYLVHIDVEVPAKDVKDGVSDYVYALIQEAAKFEEEWEDYEYASLFVEREMDEDDPDYELGQRHEFVVEYWGTDA